MPKVAVVILNYMNYQDTIACIDSVLEQKYQDFCIVVVDNGSQNESFQVLKRKGLENNLINVIRARKNYGFAKGNNIGIKYARERLGAEFVLLINNDTIMIDNEYISKLLAAYLKGVGVIGSKIILRNGNVQKPYKEIVSFPGTLIFYISLLNYVWGNTNIERKCSDYLSRYQRVEILHGSAFMLTPDFFIFYEGLYSKTFLYTEEILLYLLCKRVGIKQIYVSKASIYHKEDQSSKFLFNNENSIKLKYIKDSYKYVLMESFFEFFKSLRK